MEPDEVGWVRHSWLQSYADSDAALLVTPRDDAHGRRCEACGQWRLRPPPGRTRALAGRAYLEGHGRLIDRLMGRASVLVELNDEDGLLDGFVCFEPGVLHYLYVRLTARHTGVARRLVQAGLGSAASVVYTHRSRNLAQARLPRGWRYDPYELYRSAAA